MRKFVVFIFSALIVGLIAADHPAFLKLGQVTGFYSNSSAYEKTFYIPIHFRVKWTEARSICRDYGYEIASFETLAEAQVVQQMCKFNGDMLDYNLLVGGFSLALKNKKTWYWASSGKKINYELNWADDEPNNFENSDEFYLGLKKPDFLFNDINNGMGTKFLCETIRQLKAEDVQNSDDPKHVICNNCIIG